MTAIKEAELEEAMQAMLVAEARVEEAYHAYQCFVNAAADAETHWGRLTAIFNRAHSRHSQLVRARACQQ